MSPSIRYFLPNWVSRHAITGQFCACSSKATRKASGSEVLNPSDRKNRGLRQANPGKTIKPAVSDQPPLQQRRETVALPHPRPMPVVGPACHELRIIDAGASWRIVYHLRYLRDIGER
jgi:hypothetical protein